MSNRIGFPDDELVWRTWVLKNRLRDARHAATLLRTVKMLSILVLLVTAALWPPGIGQAVVRFAVSLGAVVVAWRGVQTQHYVAAGLFAALLLLYNPVVPVFDFSGRWGLMLVLASVLPFAGSLMRLKPTLHPA